MNKLLIGLLKRLDDLFEERDEIFENTHKWLFDSTLTPEITEDPREEQNHKEIEEVFRVINKEFAVEEIPLIQAKLPIDK